MLDTLGSMRGEIVTDWLNGESVPSNRVNSAINDAVDSLWKTLIQAALGVFMGGPVSLSIPAAAERATVVSVANPTAALTASNVAGGTLGVRNYSITFSLVTESGSETLETSTALAHAATANNLAQVDSPAFVESAIGWNLYVGTVAGRRAKQNDAPISFGAAFLEPIDGFTDEPEKPSPPSENTTGDDIFYIRHVELLTTHGGYQAWDGADISAAFMKRAAWALAAQSTYQRYYWDLINQRQFELRPAAGQALNPRYFYIKKPRRMRFDNSPLPFPNVPSIEFIRTYALSRIYLSIFEFEAAQGWATIAEQERQLCADALTSLARPKTLQVAPYPC